VYVADSIRRLKNLFREAFSFLTVVDAFAFSLEFALVTLFEAFARTLVRAFEFFVSVAKKPG